MFARLVVVVLLVTSACHQLHAEEGNADSAPVGILSDKYIDHLHIAGEMTISFDWMSIESSEYLVCKKLNENISIANLKTLLVFSDDDLTPMTAGQQRTYGNASKYFESCNYVGAYSNPLIFWEFDGNELIEWPVTDAYIDTEHSLLLVDFIDSEKQLARVLFINKEYQFYANEKATQSIWDDLKRLWMVLF
jgi:hypothetical protein